MTIYTFILYFLASNPHWLLFFTVNFILACCYIFKNDTNFLFFLLYSCWVQDSRNGIPPILLSPQDWRPGSWLTLVETSSFILLYVIPCKLIISYFVNKSSLQSKEKYFCISGVLFQMVLFYFKLITLNCFHQELQNEDVISHIWG